MTTVISCKALKMSSSKLPRKKTDKYALVKWNTDDRISVVETAKATSGNICVGVVCTFNLNAKDGGPTDGFILSLASKYSYLFDVLF